jgi:hypothetical protein
MPSRKRSISSTIDRMKGERCCKELMEATEAFNDAAVNNMFTLAESIKLVKRILRSQSSKLLFHTTMGAETEATLRQYSEHNKAVETLRALADGGLLYVLSRIDVPISVE